MAQKEMFRAVVNSPSTTLKVAINSMDTTIPVVDITIFATAPGIATLFDDNYTETIKYTSIDTVNKRLTGCTRGFDGSARDWALGKQIARLITAYDLNTFIDNIKDCFQFANDGKTSVAGVIGSPTVATETFAQITTDVQTLKNILATNLTNKGQSSTGTETLKALVDKVANVITGYNTSDATAVASNILSDETAYISTGKVTGTMINQGSKTITPNSTTQTLPAGYYSGITINPGKIFASGEKTGLSIAPEATYKVTGLTFIPTIILINRYNTSGYSNDKVWASALMEESFSGNVTWQTVSGTDFRVLTQPTDNSFTVTNSNSAYSVNSFTWIAIA